MQKNKTRKAGHAGVRAAMQALVVAAAIPLAAHGADAQSDAEARARTLVAQLTLDEKVDQLLNVAPAVPRLGVPA